VSYLLVSGMIALIGNQQNLLTDTIGTVEQSAWIYLAVGGTLFFLIFFAVAVMNYSLSTSYMILYEENKVQGFGKSDVWGKVIDKLGILVVFILLLIVLFSALMFVAIIVDFITIVGMLAKYVLQYFVMDWIGVSFFVMLSENRSVKD